MSLEGSSSTIEPHPHGRDDRIRTCDKRPVRDAVCYSMLSNVANAQVFRAFMLCCVAARCAFRLHGCTFFAHGRDVLAAYSEAGAAGSLGRPGFGASAARACRMKCTVWLLNRKSDAGFECYFFLKSDSLAKFPLAVLAQTFFFPMRITCQVHPAFAVRILTFLPLRIR